jgi:hypothetical protein
VSDSEEPFLGIVPADPTVRAVLDGAPGLGNRGGPLQSPPRACERWRAQWPELTVPPWESGGAPRR